MSELAKRDENGQSGEIRTRALLQPQFWIMKRSADVDGADYLVQLPADTLTELRDRNNQIEILGVVQCKFFENRNRVTIAKLYVLEEGVPRPEFFCSIHTDSEDLIERQYFFTANEIVDNFKLTECGGYYWFALTDERQYSEFCDLSKKAIHEKIRTGINSAHSRGNKQFIAGLFSILALPTKHFDSNPNFTYRLTFVDGVRIVLVKDNKSGGMRVLEMRRDLFQNQGDYYWGDDVIGSKFLSASLLAHHCDGLIHTTLSAENLFLNLVVGLDSSQSHHISSSQIANAAVGPPNRKKAVEYAAQQSGFKPDQLLEVVEKTGNSMRLRCYQGIYFSIDFSQDNGELKLIFSGVGILISSVQLNTDAIPPRLYVVTEFIERDEARKSIRKYGALGPVLRID